MREQPIVVNLFGGPGIGKSTIAAEAFALLKKAGYEVELIQEYAKDLVWEGSLTRLDFPIHVWAEQHHRVARLAGKVDVVVTDSPTLLSLYYADRNGSRWMSDEFTNLIAHEASRFPSITVALRRTVPFNAHGRIHNEAESVEIDAELMSFIRLWCGDEIFSVAADPQGAQAVADIVSHLYPLALS